MLAAIIVAATIAAYGPALRAGFVWDDDDYVTENPLLPAPDGLKRIWFSADAPSQYFPLVYTSFRIEYALWELEPFGYHLVNVLLHAANALLLWLLLHRIGARGAWFAAALFALHPVHVESVAWITERKNVLSLLFFLLSLLSWIRFVEHSERPLRSSYAASIGFYTLALTSKATACTLPAAQVLLLWLRGERIDARRVAQIVPFVLLGLLMGLLAILWEKFHQGTLGERFGLSLLESTLVASRAVWFYLGKLLWPVQLTFSYPKFAIDSSDPIQYMGLVAVIGLLWCLWRWRNQIGRAPLTAALFFVATLFPVLGFIPLFTFLYTYVADHYQYVASIGPIALFAEATARCCKRRSRRVEHAARVASAIVLASLGVLTWQQSRVYENKETLWRDTIAKNPDSWMAYTNLGREMLHQQRYADAIAAHRGALAIRPDLHRPRHGIASALLALGRDDEAIKYLEESLVLEPDFLPAHKQLARLRWKRGEIEQALVHYEAMTVLDPENPQGFRGMQRALMRLERYAEAKTFGHRARELEKLGNVGSGMDRESR